jgi:hypothetical protein
METTKEELRALVREYAKAIERLNYFFEDEQIKLAVEADIVAKRLNQNFFSTLGQLAYTRSIAEGKTRKIEG